MEKDILLPTGALPDAFRILCMRCARQRAKDSPGAAAHICDWAEKPRSSKCAWCSKQKAPCVPVSFCVVCGLVELRR